MLHYLKQFFQFLNKHGITYWLKWSFITLVVIEICNRASLVSWVGWIFRDMDRALLNLMIILACYLLLNALFGNRRVATVLGFIGFTLAAIADIAKFIIMDEHLYPLDFSLAHEMFALVRSQQGGMIYITLFFLSCVALIGYVIIELKKQPQKHITQRFLMFSCSAAFLAIISTALYIPSVALALDNMHNRWSHVKNYKKNGFALAFAMNLEPIMHLEKPSDYSPETIQNIVNRYASVASSHNDGIRPNIIVVMSEALFDPTELPVTYSEDPLKNLHALQAQHGKSSLISPSFAGKTCNVEFEVISGYSMSFLPEGAYPFQHYISETFPALPHILKAQGYQTVGIHSYRRNFFRRETVYPLLGYDDFISEEDFQNPTYLGKYIADDEIYQEIIDKSERMKQPYFIYAITMQNHYPFTTPADTDLTIASDKLSPESHEVLARYIAGVRDTDENILKLIEHFERVKEPTIIFFFGDHLPGLHRIYAETGFLKKAGTTFHQYTVPALLWSNYKPIPPINDVSTFYLGGYLLEQAGIAPTLPFQFLETLREKYPLISFDKTRDQDLHLHDTQALKDENTVDEHLLHDYWLLQHDVIFGERHSLKE